MLSTQNERLPHAVLDIESRSLKAKKIEELLLLNQSNAELRILEIGTGSGGIAYYFANRSSVKHKVTAVDVVDNRVLIDDYDFHLVTGVDLPFGDQLFDVVISNHVIEHVGEFDFQIEHLNQLKRVLKNNGVGYLAVPNRWMLFEPHYQLIFLSWLPKIARTPYLKLCKKGDFYDCTPLEKYELESMFSKVGLCCYNRCIEALKLTIKLERPNSFFHKILLRVPNVLLKPFIFVIPTLIYSFKKP